MGAKWVAIFSLTLTKKVSSLTSSLTYQKSELAHLKTHENGGEWVRWARSPHLSQINKVQDRCDVILKKQLDLGCRIDKNTIFFIQTLHEFALPPFSAPSN